MMWCKVTLFMLSGAAIGFALGSDLTRAQDRPCTQCTFEIAPADLKPAITWTCNGSTYPIITIPAPRINLIVRLSDGVVTDGDGNDLADLPLIEQVYKLCAALEGVAHIKFTKCGGSP